MWDRSGVWRARVALPWPLSVPATAALSRPGVAAAGRVFRNFFHGIIAKPRHAMAEPFPSCAAWLVPTHWVSGCSFSCLVSNGVVG